MYRWHFPSVNFSYNLIFCSKDYGFVILRWRGLIIYQYLVPIWIPLKVALRFQAFFFFPCAWTVKTLFMHCSYTVHRSHNTIHTIKNYFTTVFSIFSFSNNKFNPNGPLNLLSYATSIMKENINNKEIHNK